MKSNSFLVIIILFLLSCRSDEVVNIEQELMPTKINFAITNPLELGNSSTDNNFEFQYDNQQRLIKKIGGFIPLSGSTGFSGFFSKNVATQIVYENNLATVSEISLDTNLTLTPNRRIFTITNNQITEKYIPSTVTTNTWNNKKLVYKYLSNQLSEIVTSYPDMPYDPNDPYDYILTYSDKFEFNNSGNLTKITKIEKHNDIIYGGKTEITFGNYDTAKNPFKKLYLLDDSFYRSLSKNNYRLMQQKVYDNNNNVVSFSENSWDFKYDSSGNLILY